MKLQIQAQHLRVRISEDDLAQLLAGQRLESITHFAHAFTMRYALRLVLGSDAVLSGQPQAWEIALPEQPVRQHAGRLPSRDGLRFELGTGDQALTLLFDVDVRDSVRRRLK